MKKFILTLSIIFLLHFAGRSQSFFRSTSMADEPAKNAQFNVYPNPAQGQATLNIQAMNGPYVVKIFNSAGAPVFQSKESRTFQLPVMRWPTGLYYVFVTNETNDLVYREKLIVSMQSPN